MFAQLPTPPPGSIETWLISAAAVSSLALMARKLFARKTPDGEFVSRTEFHTELTSVRDKIDARFLTLGEKVEHVGATLHERLNQLEAGLARVDERTRKQ